MPVTSPRSPLLGRVIYHTMQVDMSKVRGPFICVNWSLKEVKCIACCRVMGIFPPVLVKDFAQWQAVLEATEALQMTGVRNYILTRLQDDQADIKTEPIRLLGWAMRSELPLETLKLECVYALAYRCRPLSEAEMHVLGYKASAQVMRARERIRGLFLSNAASVKFTLLLSRLDIRIQPPCGRQECQNIIFKEIIQNLSKDSPACDSEQEQDNSSVFRILLKNVSGLCHACRCAPQATLDETGLSLNKAKLDDEVRRCVFGVGPPSVGP